MKKHLTTFFTLLLAIMVATADVTAQINTPSPSPTAKVEQEVGLTDVVLKYSRPSVKGRKLFIDVEKFGKIWRTGANAATTISFSDDVKLEGHDVPAGKYALYTVPGEQEWSVMLYKDLTLGGNVNGYDESKELVRFNVNSQQMPMPIETFTIDIGNITGSSAEISLLWGTHYVPIQMTVDTDSKVMASIDQAMKNPMASVGNNYSQAANYYLAHDKDLSKALTWMDKAIEINPNAFWNIQAKAKIQAKLKDYKGAIATAKKSLETAKAAENDFGYIGSNEKLISEWSDKE